MNEIDPWSPDYEPPNVSWFRRHRVLVAVIVTGALVTGVNAGPLLWLVLEQQDELKEMRHQEHVAQQRATATLSQLQQTIDRFLFRVTEDPALKYAPGLNDLRKKMLQSALPFYEWFVTQDPKSPDAMMAYSFALGRLGLVHAALGEHGDAVAAFEKQQEILVKLLTSHPSYEEYHSLLGGACHNLALAWLELGHPEIAQQLLEKAIFHQGAALQANPRQPRYQGLLSNHQEALGTLLGKRDQPAKGEEALRQGLALRIKLLDEFTGMPEHQQALASIQESLGNLYRQIGRRAEAEAAYREALAQQERLVADHATAAEFRVDLSRTQVNLAILIRDGGAPDRALPLLDQAVAALEPLLAQDPHRFKARQSLRNACWNRAETFMLLDKPAEAIADWNKALALDDGRERWRLRQGLATALARTGDCTRLLAEIDRWAAEKGASAEQLLAGARLCALAIGAAKDLQIREQCAARAVALLREATARGFADLETLRTSDDFRNLQDREAFQTLLKELKTKAQPN